MARSWRGGASERRSLRRVPHKTYPTAVSSAQVHFTRCLRPNNQKRRAAGRLAIAMGSRETYLNGPTENMYMMCASETRLPVARLRTSVARPTEGSTRRKAPRARRTTGEGPTLIFRRISWSRLPVLRSATSELLLGRWAIRCCPTHGRLDDWERNSSPAVGSPCCPSPPPASLRGVWSLSKSLCVRSAPKTHSGF